MQRGALYENIYSARYNATKHHTEV